MRDTTTYSQGHFHLNISISRVSSKPILKQSRLSVLSDTEFIGLLKQGTTCYLNSLLQALFHLPIFRRSVFEAPLQGLSEPNKKVITALQNLFYGMEVKDKKTNTRDLTHSFGWDSQQIRNAEDAAEFYRFY
jgi:ubiquitin carboxyl-terminal hydrolase 7